MINRSKQQSQYVFNAQKGILEKVANIQNIQEKANKEQKEAIVNTVTIITSADNLVHNYFYSYETSWDASNCLQVAIIKMPKMNQENVNYWATYTGELTVYLGTNIIKNKNDESTHSSEQESANSLTAFSEDSTLEPYFRGEIRYIKEYQDDIAIYVNGIGYRFQQKIPEEFREKYIYNQNVRDSFQAMCEFLGVPFICPPKTVTENEEEQVGTETNTDGDENAVTDQLSATKKVIDQAKDIIKKKSDEKTQESKNPNEDNQENATEDANALTNNTEITPVMNGYDDVSFDANGAITHSSTIIEESLDVSETLINMEEHPLEKYLEDETGVVEKVQNFLNGKMLSELHNSVMDYGAITIQPASTTTTDMSAINMTPAVTDLNAGGTEGSGGNGSSGGSSSGNRSSKGGSSKNKGTGQKGVWGKTKNNKFYLTQDAINKMSMAEAKRRYEDGKKRNIYTSATMQKLWYRMMFGTKFY